MSNQSGVSKRPQTPGEARANGAVNCDPKDEAERTIFELQNGHPGLTQAYAEPSNEFVTAEGKAIQARRQALVNAVRPYEETVTFDTSTPGFSWKTAVASAEVAALVYAEPEEIFEQAAKWGFHDVEYISKQTPLRTFNDLFHARDVQAMVAANHDAIVVAFRGTEPGSIHDILTDLAALVPLDMSVKPMPGDLSPEEREKFNERLLASMETHLGPSFKEAVANREKPLSREQLSDIIRVLPQATAEALGDSSKTRVIADAIHRGFKEAKDLVRPQLLQKIFSCWNEDLLSGRPLRTVYLCGHSMGGSEATLFGYDLLTMTKELASLAGAAGFKDLAAFIKPGFKLPLGGVYSYEAPHSFTTMAAREVKAMGLNINPEKLIHNFERFGDPVPNLPFFGGYTNLGNTIYLDGTVGRLEDCPDPRAKALINPTKRQRKAALKERANWFDATAPGDLNTHKLGPLRDLIKRAAAVAQEQQVAGNK